jgi:hypothetical protein
MWSSRAAARRIDLSESSKLLSPMWECPESPGDWNAMVLRLGGTSYEMRVK